jgi:hypothetical protein
MISRTWGESLVAAAGVGIIIMFLGIGGLAFPIIGFFINATAAVIGLGVMVLYWIVLAILSSALTGIYRTGLYLYAKDGRELPGFGADLARTAFTGKGGAPQWAQSRG